MSDEPNSRGEAAKVWLAMIALVALLAAFAALILWLRRGLAR